MISIEQATKNITIKSKLLIGFGLVLILLIVISVVSYQALNMLTDRFALVNEVQKINLLVSEARQQEKNFILRGDLKFAEKTRDMLVKAKERAQILKQQVVTADSQANIQLLEERLDIYSGILEQFIASSGVSEGATNTNSIEDTLVKAARAADDAATQAVEMQMAKLHKESDEAEMYIVVISVLAIIFALVLVVVITRLITTPLFILISAFSDIENGDLTKELPTDRKDEVGILMQSIQKTVASLRHLIEDLTSGIEHIAIASEDMSTISQKNAIGVAQQKLETEQVATAMHEMTATVQDVARSAEEASMAATDSAKQAIRGQQVVQSTSKQISGLVEDVNRTANTMSELQYQSNAIGGVLDVIKTLADQTNLLALNAAIEAARAGDFGRGFSVVADEVRSLATRTQESAEQIEALIRDLQLKSQDAVGSMHRSVASANSTLEMAEDASKAITTISAAVDNIQLMNQQIAAAALQQSVVSEQISRNIASIRDVSEQSATASEKVAASSGNLRVLGEKLRTSSMKFKVS